MTLEYSLLLPTDALILPTKRRYFPFKIPNYHHQLRHYISTADPDLVYFVSHKVVHSIHVKSQRWDTIERIPFEPRCLAASYGWIVVGGSENGECAFITLPGRVPRSRNGSSIAASDVDSALPIELDSETRLSTPPVDVATGQRQPYGALQSSDGEIPELFTKALGGSIMNSVTIHRLPADDDLHFAHEDVCVFSNNDKTITIYSLTRRKLLEALPHTKCMNYAVISPDSRILAAVGDVNCAYFYRITRDPTIHEYGHAGERLSGWSWQLCCRAELPLSSGGLDDGSCFCISFSPSSRLCAIGSQSGIISVYDVNMILYSCSDGRADDARLSLFRSSRSDSAGAVRSMAFSPEPWDLLVWVEDNGRFGVVDVRSAFTRRQILDLNKDDPDTLKVSPLYNSPYLMRSESDRNDFGMRYERGNVRRAILDLLNETLSTGMNPDTSERTNTLRDSVHGLTERERQAIEFLNTRSSSGQHTNSGDLTSSTDTNPRQQADPSPLYGTTTISDADRPARITSPFSSTDATLQELFREHYPGRVGSTEPGSGERRRASIIISQGVGANLNTETMNDSGIHSSSNNQSPITDFQVRLRWTTSPESLQTTEGNAQNDGATHEASAGGDETNSHRNELNSSARVDAWNVASSDEALPAEVWQTSQRSRSIPRRAPRSGATTENRYDAQRAAIAADLRTSIAAERLRRQRLAANEMRSTRWIRHILSSDQADRHYGYLSQDQDPADTAGVGWGADGRTLYIGTVEGIFEFQINLQDRKSFPIFSCR